MKFEINFETIDEHEDSFIVEAETIEACQVIALVELHKRCVDPEKAWSRELLTNC